MAGHNPHSIIHFHMLFDLTMWTCFFMLGYALNLWNLAFPINHPTAFTLLHQLVAKPNLHQTKVKFHFFLS
jgi:hypothetical protein